MSQEQQPVTLEHIATQMQELARGVDARFAQQNAALAQVAQRAAQPPAGAVPTAQPPRIPPSDMERISLRVLDEFGRDPVRVLGEVRAATLEEAKREFDQRLQTYDQQRRAAEQGQQMSEQILAANPQLRGHEATLARAIEHYQTTAPHLTRDQQIQAAVDWSRQAVAAWEQSIIERHQREQHAAAQATYPQAGAYGEPAYEQPMNEMEARRARLSVIMGGRDTAMSQTRRANVG